MHWFWIGAHAEYDRLGGVLLANEVPFDASGGVYVLLLGLSGDVQQSDTGIERCARERGAEIELLFCQVRMACDHLALVEEASQREPQAAIGFFDRNPRRSEQIHLYPRDQRPCSLWPRISLADQI